MSKNNLEEKVNYFCEQSAELLKEKLLFKKVWLESKKQQYDIKAPLLLLVEDCRTQLLAEECFLKGILHDLGLLNKVIIQKQQSVEGAINTLLLERDNIKLIVSDFLLLNQSSLVDIINSVRINKLNPSIIAMSADHKREDELKEFEEVKKFIKKGILPCNQTVKEIKRILKEAFCS